MHRLNHYFKLHNSKGVKVFLPIDSVLKNENSQLRIKQEETVRSLEKQSRTTTKDVDIDKINVDEQKRIYEGVRRASEKDSRYLQHEIGSPYPSTCPAVQVAHVRRAGSLTMPYEYNHNPQQRQALHQHEAMHDHSDAHSQQCSIGNELNPHNLTEGSIILYGDPPHSGVIKWIGYLPGGGHDLMAGIEMVSRYSYIAKLCNYFVH